jgi:hypothetical protein
MFFHRLKLCKYLFAYSSKTVIILFAFQNVEDEVMHYVVVVQDLLL